MAGQPYNGDPDNYPATLTIPADDDDCEAATYQPGYEGLADRTAYLASRILGTQVVVPLIGLLNADARFTFASVSGLGIGWLQTDVTDEGQLVFHLNPALPFRARVTHVEVRLACLAQAGLPSTPPQISLLRSDSADMATVEVLGTKVDSSNQGTYESSHIVSLDCATDLTPPGEIDYDSAFDVQYFLAVRGQAGTNAAANKLMLKQVYCIIEVP